MLGLPMALGSEGVDNPYILETAPWVVESPIAGSTAVDVLQLQSTAADGYSSIGFLDSADARKLTLGYGNAGAASPYTSTSYANFLTTYWQVFANGTEVFRYSASGMTAYRNGITTTEVAGLTVANTTAAVVGTVNQYSPALILEGQAASWSGTVTRKMEYALQNRTSTTYGEPSMTLRIAWQQNSGGWTAALTIGTTDMRGTASTTGTMLAIPAQTFADHATTPGYQTGSYTAVSIGQPTFSVLNGSTYTTDVHTLYIAGAPVASTNANITRRHVIYVKHNAIATTPVYGLSLVNETDSTVGAPVQYSPSILLQGEGWDTDGANATLAWRMTTIPVSSAAPTSWLAFEHSKDGAAYTMPIYFNSAGAITITQSGLAATTAAGLTLTNTTDATVGVPVQVSPSIVWHGEVWDSDDSTNRTEEWQAYSVPSSGTVPTSLLVFQKRQDSAAFATKVTFTGGGTVNAAGNFLTDTGTVYTAASNVGLTLKGNKDAADTGYDVILAATSLTRSAGGIVQVQRPAVGTNQYEGLTLTNSTAAAAGAQQYSPMLQLTGNAWETTGGTSQAVDFAFQTQTAQGTTAGGTLTVMSRVNAGSWTNRGFWNTAGAFGQYGQIYEYYANLGTAQTAGVILENSTAAAAGAQQYSPMLLLSGYGWKTDATAGSQRVDFALQAQPQQGTSAPSVNLAVYSRINSGTWLAKSYWASSGNFYHYGVGYFGFNGGVGTAQTEGLNLYNSTAATDGAQQYSPMLLLSGYGWKTDATAGSQRVDFAFQTQPVQGTSAPTGTLNFYSRINAGSWTSTATLNTSGVFATTTIGLTGYLQVTNSGVGTTQGISLYVNSASAAADGAQQYSGMLVLRGRGWKTDATAASQPVDFALQCQPVQGAAAPTGVLTYYARINDGSWTQLGYMSSTGSLALTNNLIVDGGQIYRTTADGALSIAGNKSAGTASTADVTLKSTAVRTAGSILYVANTTTNLLDVTFRGQLLMTPAAWTATLGTSTTGQLFNIAAVTHTIDDAAGTYATWYGTALQAPTIAGAAADRIITNAATLFVAAPVASTLTITNALSAVFATSIKLTTGYIEQAEMTAPAAPGANGVRIFAQDNGAGKTQLMALFASGAAQQIAIEP